MSDAQPQATPNPRADLSTLSPSAILHLLTLGLIWGGSFLAVRLALDEVSVLSSVAHRVGWAAALLWLVILALRLPVPTGWRIWGAFAVMGFFNNVMPFTLMAWGQLHIETGLASILNASAAVWTALAAALIFPDERLTSRRSIGIGLGFAGVVTIVGPAALSGLDLRSLGQLAIVAGTFGYMASSIWARLYLSQMSPLVAAAGMLTCSTAITVPATLLLEGDIDLPTTLRGGGAIAYYALASTALAYLIYYRLVQLAGAGGVMLVTLIIPPVAIALGALVLGERLGPSAFVGFALLAAGLTILSRRSQPPIARG